MLSLSYLLSFATCVFAAGLTDSSLTSHANVLDLSFEFDPVKAAYWTGLPHHRRTPFALSPDGTKAYLAYLDSSETDVHVQQVDPTTFAAVGTAVTVTGGKEAGGLVAHNDGFALLTNEAIPTTTANAPPSGTPVPVLYRYTDGKQTFKTFLGGPGVHADAGLSMSPDLNGDLVYSEKAGLYGAYFVITDYSGNAEGHFGDSVEYVDNTGALQTISGATSSWGCSHNTGIAFEAADAAPFASICAEDQGAIWLNTKGQGMSTAGVKISNENVTNGASNEPMGGMSGSYSGLARFDGEDSYIFAWVSRGAKDLSENTWMGAGYTHSINRTNPRNVAIAQMSDKNTLVGPEAISTVGAADGDSQINWITQGANDCSNAHVATFDGTNALVTWEEISDPECDFIAMGCKGTFAGAKYQLVTDGKKVGMPVSSMNTYVAGDMVTMPNGQICWPYVDMTWQLDEAVGGYGGAAATTTQKMSFACMNSGSGNAATSSSASAAAPASSTAAAAGASSSSVAAPASSTEIAYTSSAAAAATSSSVAAPASSSASAVTEIESATYSAVPASSTAAAAGTSSSVAAVVSSSSAATTSSSIAAPAYSSSATATSSSIAAPVSSSSAAPIMSSSSAAAPASSSSATATSSSVAAPVSSSSVAPIASSSSAVKSTAYGAFPTTLATSARPTSSATAAAAAATSASGDEGSCSVKFVYEDGTPVEPKM